MIYCPFGNVLDSNGCPTCSCNSAPVEKSKSCFGVMCLIHCQLGFKLGSDACPGCVCTTVTPLPTITPPSTTMVMRVRRL
ncbi:antistasin-like [Haliotis cracherodii]|uniref:antistasin-like n=1 Tax=Haliotis cracherodii TaxID=6455 RepID=UPI0039EB314A